MQEDVRTEDDTARIAFEAMAQRVEAGGMEAGDLELVHRTGQRLDDEAPNLDRLAVATNKQGRLTVDVTKRTCTQRDGAQSFAPITCP